MAAKLMTITIKVEPPALGPVILKLKEMPGVAELNFDLSDPKAGEPVAPPQRRAKPEEIMTALLIRGPASLADVQRALVAGGMTGTKTQAYGVVHAMKRKGIAKTTAEKGVYELTAKAAKSIKGHEDSAIRLLPKPKANGKDHTLKRQLPGEGPKRLLTFLASHDGPVQRQKILEHLASQGVSEKSFSGLVDRTKKAGHLKSSGIGLYELTAKGKAQAEQANG